MNVIILGAGASKAYNDSPTGQKMPIANDFFKTFHNLDIASNTWVLIGNIINYVALTRNKEILDFLYFNEDIEILHSEVKNKLIASLSSSKDNFFTRDNFLDNMQNYKAYLELVFLFTSVINEIQNGPTSKPHLNLIKHINPEDSIITFNWDTLMDKALFEATDWNTSDGYYVKPSKIYRNEWVDIENKTNKNYPYIIKLHGSTNWLTSHIIPEKGKLEMLQETNAEDFYIYESTKEPYSTYDGRFMPGYTDFAYGYYPPNLPLKGKKIPDGMMLMKNIIRTGFNPKGEAESFGLVSMPLIIPPVHDKEYDFYGDIFSTLWSKAEEDITKAKKIILIGYSFPITDIRTNNLFKNAFLKRDTIPQVIIVNPNSALIEERFIYEFGISKENITVYNEYFDDNFDLEKLF
ncbi:MAG: hypothetical protein ABI549_04270 [Flavobacterium sp.]|uniref:hypothetical protein n=1 Tax=Flavobacterium sp. TaxID=239 RepID=UPI003262D5A7